MTYKLLLYITIINLIPFYVYDRLYNEISNKTLSYEMYTFITQPLTKTLLFILIYTFIQILLYKYLLKNLYNRKLISNYVRE